MDTAFPHELRQKPYDDDNKEKKVDQLSSSKEWNKLG